METQVALTQLNPIGQHIVVFVDLVREFTDIVEFLLTPLASHQVLVIRLVDDAVDKWRDAIDEGDLGTLLQTESLAILHPEPLYSQLLVPLFEEVVGDVLTPFAAIHVVEEPEQEREQADGDDDGAQHDVQLHRGLLVLTRTGLQLTVLAGGFLQVEI